MFKGILIENQSYYHLRSNGLWYSLLFSIVTGLLVNFYQLPMWITIGAITLYIALMFVTSRNQKAFREARNKRIEIGLDKIQIKEVSGNIIETINIETHDKIIVKNDYKMAQESINDIKEEMKGNTEKHFLILDQHNKQRRFDFEIESYYMLNQLNKIVKR